MQCISFPNLHTLIQFMTLIPAVGHVYDVLADTSFGRNGVKQCSAT